MIKVFILTYNAPSELDGNLTSLYSSEFPKDYVEVNVINNHSTNFAINYNTVKVHHQSLRADWGCGHPARDWNQSIVLGIGNLNNPKCEQIILCQDDCIWDKDWYEKLMEVHKTYDFYQCSWGDCFISMLPSAVKKIGLFDERMCSLGYYEGDYLIRAYIYNKEKSSINDYHHKRIWNPTVTVANRSTQNISHPSFTNFGRTIFSLKWPNIGAKKWESGLFKNTPKHSSHPSYIYYPYFECDIENLKEKNYIIPEEK